MCWKEMLGSITLAAARSLALTASIVAASVHRAAWPLTAVLGPMEDRPQVQEVLGDPETALEALKAQTSGSSALVGLLSREIPVA